jgi:hypothetical protein
MTRRDPRPREVLGEDLWEVLGHASEVSSPREVLGPELWELLGQASEVQPPAPRPIPRPAPPPPWRGLALALLAAAVPFVLIPSLRPEVPAPDDDLALLRELDLAETLDLVSHPDFELLLRWDGRTP